MIYTVEGLEALLRTVNRATFVTITARTDVPMNKVVLGTPNPFWKRTRKLAKVNGVIKFDYTRTVNNRRDKEDKETDFVGLPRTWGEWIDNTPLVISSKGNISLVIKVERYLGHQYEVDGEVTPDDVVEPWLKEKPPEGARQELEKPVLYRNYRLDNLVGLALDGDWFQVENQARVVV